MCFICVWNDGNANIMYTTTTRRAVGVADGIGIMRFGARRAS